MEKQIAMCCRLQACLVNGFVVLTRPLQLYDRFQDPTPDNSAVFVAIYDANTERAHDVIKHVRPRQTSR